MNSGNASGRSAAATPVDVVIPAPLTIAGRLRCRVKLAVMATMILVLWGGSHRLVDGADVTTPPERRAPIVQLRVDTLTNFTTPLLRQLTGIREGGVYDPEEIRTSLDQLYDTGLFSNIVVDAVFGPEGVGLTYHLLPKQWIRELTITGKDLSISVGELRKQLALSVNDEFRNEQWQTGLAHLLQHYNREGYYGIHLEPVVTVQEDQTSVHLSITVIEGEQATIQTLDLVGSLGLPEKRVRSLLGIEPGDGFSTSHLEQRIKKLQQTYEDKQYLLASVGAPSIDYDHASNRVTVSIMISSGPVIDVEYQGNPYWFRTPFKSQVLIQAEKSLSEDILEASSARIQAFLRGESYLTASVSHEVDYREDGQSAMVVFRITAGPRFEVQTVHLTGNAAFATNTLLKSFKTRPRFFGLSHPQFDPVQWTDDLSALRRFYQTQGFLSSAIEEERALHPDEGTIELTVVITEGPQTRIAEIRIAGDTRVPEGLLRATLTHHEGEPYDSAQARADRLTLAALLAGKGYIDVDVTLQPQLNAEQTEVILIYSITEGPPAFIGQILLEGNQQTADAVIRRELLVQPGDPYNYELILRSRHRITRLGIFRDVRIEPLVEEPTGQIRDLKLSVTERPAGAVEFGFGYATEEAFRGFVQLSHKNLAGTGRRATLRVEADQLEQRYLVNYVEPWLARLPIDLRVTGLLESREEVTFDRTSYGGTTGFEKPLTDRLTFSLFYRYTKNRFRHIVTGAVLPPKELRRVNIGSIRPALTLDMRDDPFNPTRGFVAGIAFEDAALSLGSEVQFVKITGSSSFYFSPHPVLVLAFSGRSGWAYQFGNSTAVPLSERFYLGGRSTVRGYTQDALGVFGNTLSSNANDPVSFGKPLGGNFMALTNVEARIALPKNLGLVLFLDAGNVWTSPTIAQWDEIKYSTGVGIRYNTPVGPLRLDWGYKLNRERIIDLTGVNGPAAFIESRYEIHFTLGHTF